MRNADLAKIVPVDRLAKRQPRVLYGDSRLAASWIKPRVISDARMVEVARGG